MSTVTSVPTPGMRVNGKQWHPTKKAFRPTAGQTSYVKRIAKESQQAETKKLEQEMKVEKEEERQVRLDPFLCLFPILIGLDLQHGC